MEHGDTKPYFTQVFNKYNKANFFIIENYLNLFEFG